MRRCHVWLIGVFAQVRGGSQVFPGRASEARRMGSGGLPWPPGPPDPESKDLIDLDSGPDFSFEFFGALDSISRVNFRKIKHMVLGPAGNRRFVGVWAAPAAPKTHSKRWGGLAPPPSGMVGGAAGAAQTPRDRERERERERERDVRSLWALPEPYSALVQHHASRPFDFEDQGFLWTVRRYLWVPRPPFRPCFLCFRGSGPCVSSSFLSGFVYFHLSPYPPHPSIPLPCPDP